jgi:putative addiction module killer protein
MPRVRVVEYFDGSGRSTYTRWFSRLNAIAAAKVATSLYRLEAGNYSNTKSVGAGVLELRIDFGPGYRLYFGMDGDTLVVLGGSIKKDQQRAIKAAHDAWADYKLRKRQKDA